MSGQKQKPFEETYRGKREAKKMEMARRKQQKEEDLKRKKELNDKGLCVGPDKQVYTHAEVGKKYGRIFGTAAWNEADTNEQEKRKAAGKIGSLGSI